MASRNPVLGPPRDCWDEIPEAIQAEIQDHVQESTALGYSIVVGWANAAAVVGLTMRSLQRAVAKGRLPKFRESGRGPRGSRVVWPLSFLWDFRKWRETLHKVPEKWERA